MPDTLPSPDTFSLGNFEGSLDFLLQLIQKEELQICDIPIQELIQQFLQKLSDLDKGAEFVGTAAYLVWLKSRALLPPKEEELALPEQEEDPRFEIIHHLIDYCRFKQAAKELGVRQEQQQACYFRGTAGAPEWKKPLGINHISLEELASLFQDMLKRAPPPKGQIQEENWRVSDKILLIRRLLNEQSSLAFEPLFFACQARLEMVVTFLAVLELMKLGVAAVGKDPASARLMIVKQE